VKNISIKWIVIISLLFTSNAFANTNGCCCCLKPILPTKGVWYVDLAAGWVFNYHADQYTVSQQSFFPDVYFSNNNQNSEVVALSGGYSWHRDDVWLPILSLGLEYSYYFPIKSTGFIQKFFSPNLTDYTYEFKTHFQQLNLLAKANIYRWSSGLSPYLLGGIGNSWNTLNSYTEMALPGITPRIPPGFSKGTTSNFVYILGFGMDYDINKNFQIGLGYRYDVLGKAHSGNGVSTFANVDLKGRSNLSTLLLNLRYYFA
jgi:opacity protein-like surface antigen